ncbi:coiled-coil domain-containing protein 22 homolog isoform X2 [Anthonomus grandis grandis]|nr:coiled-coil domain-containing protein 22 homolog isoform X2 [Anthonomus grandis grandis]
MNPQIKLPKKLPASMSARIKFASSLAEQIKEYGFKGDMGYQTILYCNEVEVRRVLTFLLERLPKESNNAESQEPIGYVPKIVKQIEDRLQQALSKTWLPSHILHYGVRPIEDGYIVNSFGNSAPIDTVSLIIPEDNLSPDQAAYIPNITDQCNRRQLIPSLLFHDTDFSAHSNWKQIVSKASVPKSISNEILANIANSTAIESLSSTTSIPGNKNLQTSEESKSDVLLKELGEKKCAFINLQADVSQIEEKLEKIRMQKGEEQKLLEELIANVNVKKKTLAVLHNPENKQKLKNIIQKLENRLVELADQWNEVQTPLLQELNVLKSSVGSETLKNEEERNKLNNLRATYKELVDNFKEKSVLEENLIERCKDLNNRNNRAAYTKRIMDIVGNIKKQKKEIQKILVDTKKVQKDISNLTGQVERSFTLSDEIIFHDCKHDESARKAYKLLAALREECNRILQAISDIGQVEREFRNLDEQTEAERNKDVCDKLRKIQRDLTEIQKEIQLLL